MNILHRCALSGRARLDNAAGPKRVVPRPRQWLLMGLLGASCTGWAQTPPAPSTAPAPAAALSVLPGEPTQRPAASALNAPLFYQLLVGELNVVGGDPGSGYSLILDAARKQRDALLYRRAVEVALQARSGEASLAAARTWAQDLPQDINAHRFTLQILLALNRPEETGPALRVLLDRTPAAERNETIQAIPQTFARLPDKSRSVAVVRDLLAPYLKQREHAASAWTTIGRMELGVDRLPLAYAAARQGHAVDPASAYPALLALELMERGQTDAEALVRHHLQVAAPAGAATVALPYARLLLDLQRNTDARRQLDALTRHQPDIAEPWLLLASLQVQENALGPATQSLQTFMGLARQAGDERAARGLTQAYLLMAQIAEKQGDFAGATAWLDRIENANDIMAAQMRRASLLARQGQLAQARALLRNQPERRPADARLKLVAEAQLLRDLKAFKEAYEVYGEAAQRFPDDADLKYDQAMMAEKAGLLDAMERLLREVIAAKPDYHHAYNALGYALADRNVRLAEAKQLIEKAVELAPNDAYIQDSLGWVEFRLGNTARALQILQAAYGKRPDAEIAAHLGEVLWVAGRRDEALKIWREGLLLASDNETLLDVLKRFKVQP